ncbi:MAG: hypothetical protein KAI79_13990 [Bacteroidales bacterium]|nr:hypothetical protein [Bacteroidales bacterium]
MRIEFKKVEYRNVLGSGNALTVYDFHNGIDLIVGKNGKGKSTIVDAITFGLFGKPFRKIKIGSLVNNINKRDMHVELTFNINDSEFKIERGQFPVKFKIYKRIENDWSFIDQHSNVLDYQKYLEENILHFGLNTFRQLIALGANLGSSRNFMDLTSREKEEILEIITDTAIFNKLRDKIRERKLSLKTKETDLNYQFEIAHQGWQSEKITIQQLETQNKQFNENKDETLNQYKINIEMKKSKIAEYEIAIKKILGVGDNLKVLKEEAVPITKEREMLYNNISDANSMIKLHQKNEKEKITCPNCEFEIKSDLQFNIEDIKWQLPRDEADYHALDRIVKDKDQKISSYEIIVSNEQRLRNNKKTIQDEIVILEDQIKVTEMWKSTEIDYNKEKQLHNKSERIKIDLLQAQNDLSEYNDLEELIGDKNIKKVILNQQLPFMNKYINEFLELFESKFNFIIDEQLKETIISHKSEAEFNALSNGQKQRITISILFSFLKLIEERNGISTNLLILDEYLDSSLDVEGIEEVLRILSEVFAPTKNIILISHNPDIKDRFDIVNRSYTATMVDGFSKLILNEKG